MKNAAAIILKDWSFKYFKFKIQIRADIEFVRSRAMFQLGLFDSLELGAAATSNDGKKIGFFL